jgi:hypothetical protein
MLKTIIAVKFVVTELFKILKHVMMEILRTWMDATINAKFKMDLSAEILPVR